MSNKLFKSRHVREAAGFAVLAALLALTAGCSQAPLITFHASRQVFSELFSTTE
ncbi:MAG TPA: hypothetical protein VMH22_06530 [bacterium]|nr:hypothetical protein [bacterium]